MCTSVEERMPPCRFQRLFVLLPTTSCLPVFTSQERLCSLLVHVSSGVVSSLVGSLQEFGGEYMRIHPNLTRAFNVAAFALI